MQLQEITLAGSVPSLSVVPGAVTVAVDTLTLGGEVVTSVVGIAGEEGIEILVETMVIKSEFPKIGIPMEKRHRLSSFPGFP